MPARPTRRQFLQYSFALSAGAAVPYFFSTVIGAEKQSQAANDRPNVGCIGNGSKGRGDASAASRYGNIVALCDVDRSQSEAMNKRLCKGKATCYEDYRELLARKDIEIVTISTPDHWHAKIAIDAMRAGKDVYCQKPLTLTIEEGQKILKAAKATGRVFQVGTQQRSEYKNMFLTAIAMVHAGRIGKVRRVTCAIGPGTSGGPFEKTTPPKELNWERWLGQAPLVDYIKERCHRTFRWWYEYSGGKMTDWGAHHVDIAQWAIGMDHSGPISVEPVAVEHPVELRKGMPTRDDTYNTATTFTVRCMFANGVELLIGNDLLPEQKGDESRSKETKENGILFEGEKGRFFVNRGKLVGAPVDELASSPIAEETLVKLRKGKPLGDHMQNFILCVKDRSQPVSDVATHHRAMTTCHLANIAIRLGRKLQWDAQAEQFVGDAEANTWLSREQRKGYEVEA